MDFKSKYRAWVDEKHADISVSLTNSDIEVFAIEFAEWLVKNCLMPNVSEVKDCEHDYQSIFHSDLEVGYYCPKCKTLKKDW